jgi:predicted PurR-regulated permease PerM
MAANFSETALIRDVGEKPASVNAADTSDTSSLAGTPVERQAVNRAARDAAATPVPTPFPQTGDTTEIEVEPERILLHMPVDIRSTSLMVLAILAGLFVLNWAKAVLIPIMLGVLCSYALSPIVNWLEDRHVPRWLSSAVLLVGILGGLGSTAWSLSDEAAQLVESLPTAAQKLAGVMRTSAGDKPTPLQTVQRAAAQLEQAARSDAGLPAKGVTRVIVEPNGINIRDYLWTGGIGLAALIGQITVVIFLTYFLMISGDTFRRKMLKLAGPRLSSKKLTLQALHEVTYQIQRYLQVQVLTSVVVGVLTWLALAALGLDNALVWGIAAAVLNLVPYVGTILIAGASSMVAFLQFGTLNMALLVGGASMAIHAVTGNLLTPWLTSKASRMSPVAVFVGMLAWGWLWGVWGLLLGIPILMIVKAICDRVEDLKPIGEFLGD